MRDQLCKYVELLFAGTSDTDEIRQEILQNSLDRFDDLVAQGKAPEAAYRLTISGIGDINEILGQPKPQESNTTAEASVAPHSPASAKPASNTNKLLRAIAIALYILCAIPVIFFEEIGLCVTLIIVAIATGILIYIGKDDAVSEENNAQPEESAMVPKSTHAGLRIANAIIWLGGLAIYFAVSFLTRGWYITWLIFPMLACVRGIVRGIFDLKEACSQ